MPPHSNHVRFWQVLAIVAVIAATAGWTTVAVMALRPASAAVAVAVAAPTEDALPSDDPGLGASDEPPVESHDVADLEPLLPAELDGTSLTRESWTGDTILGDDSSWTTSMTAFLTSSGKIAADLQASQAYDPAGALDLNAGAFRVAGVDGNVLRDAIIAAWKGDFPDLKTAQTTIGGLAVTTGDFGDGGIATYWYVRDGVVFDIESSDPTLAAAALAALPVGAGPASSAAPSARSSATDRPGPSPS